MIQRLQSLYLLLTTILSGLFLTGDFIKFINPGADEVRARFDGIFRMTAEKGFTQVEPMNPVCILSLMIPVLSLALIFFFKKRRIQRQLTIILLVLEIILIAVVVYYLLSLNQGDRHSPVIGFFTFIPLLTIIFTILAYRGIRKDDNLVKSYERMR